MEYKDIAKIRGIAALTVFGGAGLLYLILNRKDIDKTVIEQAKKYLYIREVKKRNCENNCGFNDSSFEWKLRRLGWQPTWDWCLYFVELVLLESFKKLKLKEHYRFVLENFEKGSTQRTWKNIRTNKSNIAKIISKPETGAVVFWRRWYYDKKQWKADPVHGHTGIVVKVFNDGSYLTIEGNVNNRVKYKRRRVNYSSLDGSLQLLGFVKFQK